MARLPPRYEHPPDFEVKPLKSYRTATERQVAEALNIECGDHDSLLNSKSEFGRNAIAIMDTRFKDKIWGQKTSKYDSGNTDTGSGNNNKRFADKTLSAGDTDFASQCSQRRKCQRQEKETDPVNVATESGNRRLQRTRGMATTSFILGFTDNRTVGNTKNSK